MLRVGIDTGGTFTDLLAVDDNGKRTVLKVPSTPSSPDQAVHNALKTLLDSHGVQPNAIQSVIHGTTVAVNAILQNKLPVIGMITTKGFRHILELARQTIPGERGSLYTWTKPPRIVHLSNVKEVGERMTASGDVLTSLDEDSVVAAAKYYEAQGITSVAVCLLNAYSNETHERQVRDIFARTTPDCSVTLSAETLPEFREYERAVTTCFNAALAPVLGHYVSAIRNHLDGLQITAPLFIMKSAGGATRAAFAITNPIHTALSGTAAAVIGSAWIGRTSSIDNLITFDMGGTSTDVAMIENGNPALVAEFEINNTPIRSPAVDVISIGAGGGSLAQRAPGQRFKVGPESAGAVPGPACYGLGNTEPTITDANIFLGRLSGDLAGGTVKLDRVRAEQALERLGKDFDLNAPEMAAGILEVGEMNMADAIREVSVKRGRDPRHYTLIAGGGAGPLHAASLAEKLSIPTVIVPPHPGIGCALGALVSDVREDFIMTDIQSESLCNVARLASWYAALEHRATDALSAQGFAVKDQAISRSADVRYVGMRTELTVPVPPGPVTEDLAKRIFDALHDVHEATYGYAYRHQQECEIVNLRVTGTGHLPNIPPASISEDSTSDIPPPHRTRNVYFPNTGFIQTTVYDRTALTGSDSIVGPAIIEQYDSTTVVLPGQRMQPDRFGNLIISTSHRISAQDES